MENFILKLDNALVKEFYDKRMFLDILNMIKDYFKAEACSFDMSKFNEGEIITNQPEHSECLTFGNLHIYNPQVKITDFMQTFLLIYSKNLLHLYNLWRKSHIDDLTNVYNYNSLCEQISKSSAYKNIGIAFIDANGLGLINNTQGHEEGDKMLMTIAMIINRVFRQREIFRKGGDEFIILCNDIPEDLFNEKINKIKKLLSMTDYSASIGTTYALKTDNILEQIRLADIEMYKEKEIYKINHPNKYGIK